MKKNCYAEVFAVAVRTKVIGFVERTGFQFWAFTSN